MRNTGVESIVTKKTQKPVMASFGAVVSERRKLLDMSQETLAERVGIAQESLSRMEKGFIAPRFERLQLFADALGCSIADLFRSQNHPGDRAATLEQIIAPLSDYEQRELVEAVAKIAALIATRHPAERPESRKP